MSRIITSSDICNIMKDNCCSTDSQDGLTTQSRFLQKLISKRGYTVNKVAVESEVDYKTIKKIILSKGGYSHDSSTLMKIAIGLLLSEEEAICLFGLYGIFVSDKPYSIYYECIQLMAQLQGKVEKISIRIEIEELLNKHGLSLINNRGPHSYI